MLTPQEIETNKIKFIRLLESTEREGMKKVLEFLEESDFYKIPSSLKRHHDWEGGLVQHCLGVYDRLKTTGENLPSDSVIITSLLHDICKAGKIYNENGEWKERHDDELEIPGHGDRSVHILKNLGLKLSPEEIKAIKWHMGGWKIGERSKEDIKEFFGTKNSDLWRLLHNADRYNASHNS
ncbi:MAG: HD domain-containing protein [Muribaculaceae bacterium]|nr:HD domain-containing protein [Muribaculaceae bacterium]